MRDLPQEQDGARLVVSMGEKEQSRQSWLQIALDLVSLTCTTGHGTKQNETSRVDIQTLQSWHDRWIDGPRERSRWLHNPPAFIGVGRKVDRSGCFSLVKDTDRRLYEWLCSGNEIHLGQTPLRFCRQGWIAGLQGYVMPKS